MFIDIEARKQGPSPPSHDSSSSVSLPSLGSIDELGVEYGKMMSDLIEILENKENSLKKMKRAFVHMAHYAECTVYTDIIQSEQYRAVDSVEALFELLAPHLKPPDCSLLNALVSAAVCDEAMQRFTEYLDKSHGPVFTTTIEKSSVSPPGKAPESESDTDAAADSNPVISSEPVADSSTVCVTAKVDVNEMSWGNYRRKKSFLCGLFRVPPFALLFGKGEPGSVIIKWTTSRKIALHMQSIVLDDGDLKLLMQERIVSVRVGMDYKIQVESQDYWMVSHKLHIVYRLQCKLRNPCMHCLDK